MSWIQLLWIHMHALCHIGHFHEAHYWISRRYGQHSCFGLKVFLTHISVLIPDALTRAVHGFPRSLHIYAWSVLSHWLVNAAGCSRFLVTCYSLVSCWHYFRPFPPKRRFTYGLHGAISQKMTKFITTAVRTSHPITHVFVATTVKTSNPTPMSSLPPPWEPQILNPRLHNHRCGNLKS
jgi:hypothetical protein